MIAHRLTILTGLAAVLLFGLSLSQAGAVKPDEILADPALEARARAISGELRCMVCQNQSIDDSDAPLARDLRLLVRDRLQAGDSNTAVRDFLVARYGQFVLLKPMFSLETAVLWIGPFALLAIGAVAIGLAARRHGRRGGKEPAALSAEEKARLDEIMAPGP